MTRLPKTDKITPIKAHLWKHKVAKPESKTVTRCNDRSAAISGNTGRCSLFVYTILSKRGVNYSEKICRNDSFDISNFIVGIDRIQAVSKRK